MLNVGLLKATMYQVSRVDLLSDYNRETFVVKQRKKEELSRKVCKGIFG